VATMKLIESDEDIAGLAVNTLIQIRASASPGKLCIHVDGKEDKEIAIARHVRWVKPGTRKRKRLPGEKKEKLKDIYRFFYPGHDNIKKKKKFAGSYSLQVVEAKFQEFLQTNGYRSAM
jgi:hypothetical protein